MVSALLAWCPAGLTTANAGKRKDLAPGGFRIGNWKTGEWEWHSMVMATVKLLGCFTPRLRFQSFPSHSRRHMRARRLAHCAACQPWLAATRQDCTPAIPTDNLKYVFPPVALFTVIDTQARGWIFDGMVELLANCQDTCGSALLPLSTRLTLALPLALAWERFASLDEIAVLGCKIAS